MLQSIQSLIDSWSVPFYAGWSIMRVFYVTLILSAVTIVVNAFYDKAGK